VTTAAEELEGGKKALRCRLRSLWSLLAGVAFGAASGALLMLCLWLTKRWPWIWLILLVLPLFAVLMEREKRTLQRILAALLGEVAQGLDLVDLSRGTTPEAAPLSEPARESRVNRARK
jgi:MFS family permease